MVNQKKQEILSQEDMESALIEDSLILVEVNHRPVRMLKENILVQAFLGFSREFHRKKSVLLNSTYNGQSHLSKKNIVK